ncbi:2-oxoglutarate dehydrogenase, E2 component, dihydrolipoamide succinyltransferase, partial [Kitasatospora sp. NPDC059463]
MRERAAETAAAAPAGTGPDGAEAARERSPEEARATFASFQRGFTRGRGATGAPAAPAPPPRPAPSPRPVPGWQPPDPGRRAISPA